MRHLRQRRRDQCATCAKRGGTTAPPAPSDRRNHCATRARRRRNHCATRARRGGTTAPPHQARRNHCATRTRRRRNMPTPQRRTTAPPAPAREHCATRTGHLHHRRHRQRLDRIRPGVAKQCDNEDEELTISAQRQILSLPTQIASAPTMTSPSRPNRRASRRTDTDLHGQQRQWRRDQCQCRKRRRHLRTYNAFSGSVYGLRQRTYTVTLRIYDPVTGITHSNQSMSVVGTPIGTFSFTVFHDDANSGSYYEIDVSPCNAKNGIGRAIGDKANLVLDCSSGAV